MWNPVFHLLAEGMQSWVLKDKWNLTEWNRNLIVCAIVALVCMAKQQCSGILLSKKYLGHMVLTVKHAICSGLILEARKKCPWFVIRWMSLCCWKWKSKLAFHRPALLAALKECRFLGHRIYTYSKTLLKNQFFVNQIEDTSLWRSRQWNEKP